MAERKPDEASSSAKDRLQTQLLSSTTSLLLSSCSVSPKWKYGAGDFLRSEGVRMSDFFKNSAIALIVIALFAGARASKADDTIVLELPPSQANIEHKAAQKRQDETRRLPEIPRENRNFPPREEGLPLVSRGSPRASSRRQDGASSAIGRLGQTLQEVTIYRNRNERSGKLSRIPAGVYLAVKTESEDWLGILMSDNSIGWMKREAVKILDYQVTATSSGGARPFDDTYSDGLPSGKNPFFRGDPNALFREAYRYLGVPYHWGGNTHSGIDCSGFVQNVFSINGYSLPRVSRDQLTYGLAVSKDQLEPGDRLYFGNRSTQYVTHTGLYLGNGYFIHSSSSRHGVAVSHLSESMFMRIYVCARR